MSIRDVRKYHMRMTADYKELKDTLKKLESEITPESSKNAIQSLDTIKKQVAVVEENFNRINYIMYLLDIPQRKKKQQRWEAQNKKKIDSIPEKDRLDNIHNENKNMIKSLNEYI